MSVIWLLLLVLLLLVRLFAPPQQITKLPPSLLFLSIGKGPTYAITNSVTWPMLDGNTSEPLRKPWDSVNSSSLKGVIVEAGREGGDGEEEGPVAELVEGTARPLRAPGLRPLTQPVRVRRCRRRLQQPVQGDRFERESEAILCRHHQN